MLRKKLFGPAIMAFLFTSAASAGSLDPTSPVSISLPYATTVDNGASVLGNNDGNVPAPYDNCSADEQNIWYTFNSGSSTSLDFFAIGEDTEILIAEMPGVLNCEGNDDDAEPTFSDLGLSEPSGWPVADISNSELWEDITVSPNTTYILALGHNADDNDSDCIAWGIKDSGDAYPAWTSEACPLVAASATPATPVPTLPVWGLLSLTGLLGLFGFRKLR